MLHDSLFAYNTQCSTQYVPSLLPITGWAQSPTPSPLKPSVCFQESTDSHDSFLSAYRPFILPFLLLPIFLLFLMFHKWVKPYDNCLSLLDLFHLANSFSFLHLFLLRNTSLEDREQACLPLTIKTVVSPGSMFLSWNILTEHAGSHLEPPHLRHGTQGKGNKLYSIVYTDHIFLIQSSVEGHLGTFHDLAIVDNTDMNIGVHMALLFTTSVSLG